MSQSVQSLPADAEADPGKAKSGKLGLILGLAGALVLGGGGFYAVYSGLLDPGAIFGGGGGHEAEPAAAHGKVAFVRIDPILISLPPGSSAKFLRFTGQLEVLPENAEEVTALMPRVLDALNTYLRAVEIRDLETPAMTAKIRAQMLRRVQIVTGAGLVQDLLISEFVLN